MYKTQGGKNTLLWIETKGLKLGLVRMAPTRLCAVTLFFILLIVLAFDYKGKPRRVLNGDQAPLT